MQDSTINLKHYVSVVSYLLFESAKIVKECAENPNLKKFDKGVNDPVTEADYKIQTYLIKGIRHFFPALKIVGEETKEYEGLINLNFQEITLDNYPEDCEFEEKVPLSQLCLWIDPIDNTRGFIKDKFEGVTVLVGMSRNCSAFLGMIATPYSKINGTTTFKPFITLGYLPQKKAYKTEQFKKWALQIKPPKRHPIKLVSSKRLSNHQIDEVGEIMQAELEKLGGSGRKMIMVAQGQADALVYLGESNCRWDSCAGQAIIKSLGGFFSDQNGAKIVYEMGSNYVNKTGNVCSMYEEVYTTIIQAIQLLSKKQ